MIKPTGTVPLRAPRAAAVAGILFAGLLIASIVLLRWSVPADPLDPGGWLKTGAGLVLLALHLVPFAGIAFLWFIGVLRDRLGAAEDRFFATVFLGSGLLFLAMLFLSAAAAGGLMIAYRAAPDGLLGSPGFTVMRAFMYVAMNVYAVKMAGVFMIVTSTLGIRTGFIRRWIALCGYVLAALLLLSIGTFAQILLVFPLWVLLVSVDILIDRRREPTAATTGAVYQHGE